MWDSRYSESFYIFFEDYFVKIVINMYGYPWDYSVSDEIKKFLRSKEFYER